MNEGLAVWTRALLYVGALVAIGRSVMAVRQAHWRSAGGRVHEGRVLRGLGWFGALALVAAPVLMLHLQLAALEMPWSDTLTLVSETSWGRGFRVIAVAALATAVVLPLRFTRQRAWMALVLAMVLSIAMGGVGHAASEMRWPIAARVIDALHVITVGLWIGGLLVTWLSTRQAGFHDPDAAWRQFSGMATVAAPLAVVTGVAGGARMLLGHPLEAIVASPYGQMLIVKTIMVGIVLLIGASQRARIARGTLAAGRSVAIELAMAAWVLLVTATLTGTEPPE